MMTDRWRWFRMAARLVTETRMTKLRIQEESSPECGRTTMILEVKKSTTYRIWPLKFTGQSGTLHGADSNVMPVKSVHLDI